MLHVGVIGLGFMGRMHVAAYGKMPDVKVVAIADADPARARGDFSGQWGNIAGAAENLDMTGVTGATDYRELLAMPDVDLVDICVPTPLHEELAVAALRAGKHVLCEKPLALDSATAGRIAAAAAAAPGMFMTGLCIRFWPEWAWLKQAVADGRYGRVRDAAFRRCGTPPPGWFLQGDLSGGAILDLHVHDTDFVYYLFGMPRAVFSRGYIGPSGRTDCVVTQYLYPDGPDSVTAKGSWCMADGFGFAMQYTVNFERATAEYVLGRDPALQVCRAGQREPMPMEGDGYVKEIEYFVDCIRRNQRPTIVTAADGVADLRIIEAEQRSVLSGRVEEV